MCSVLEPDISTTRCTSELLEGFRAVLVLKKSCFDLISNDADFGHQTGEEECRLVGGGSLEGGRRHTREEVFAV